MASQAEIDLIVNATNTLGELQRDIRRIVNIAERTAPPINIPVRVDRDDNLRRLTSTLGGITGTLGRVAGGIATVGAAAGTAAPLLAGLAAATQQIAPAAAVATTGMVALGLTAGTLQLGFAGLEDAITAAFDPKKSPEDLAKAMEQLAPNAREFVGELVKMKSSFKNLQLDVQDRLFANLGGGIERLSRTVLPQVGAALGDTADSLNKMAIGAIKAADQLGTSGTLQRALDGATKGIENLADVPARAVTGFGQLAAAAAPAFDRITAAADRASVQIADRLSAAFESGALEDAINNSIDAIRQLVTVGGNLLGGLRNIISGLTVDGGGLFDQLEKISQAFEDLTASSEFQTILTELSATMATLVQNVLPLLQEAFVQLAPVIALLGPPLREFIDAIGPSLQDVIKELGPVLVDLATIFRDQMPTAIVFVTAALEDLALILKGVHFVLTTFVVPALRFVSDVINSEFVQSVAGMSRFISEKLLSVITDFDGFKQRVTGALNQVKTQFVNLKDSAIRSLATMVTDAIAAAQRFAAGLVAKAIQAKDSFVRAVSRMVADAVSQVRSLPGKIIGALSGLAGTMFSIGANIIAGLVNGISSKIGSLRSIAASAANAVTGQIRGLLGIHSPSTVTTEFGENTVQGFINGIRNLIPALKAELATIATAVPVLAGVTSATTAPTVNTNVQPLIVVNVGNEQLDSFIDTRISQNNQTRNRVASQGVRR